MGGTVYRSSIHELSKVASCVGGGSEPLENGGASIPLDGHAANGSLSINWRLPTEGGGGTGLTP